jgi:hypothetical protein
MQMRLKSLCSVFMIQLKRKNASLGKICYIFEYDVGAVPEIWI